MRWLTILAVALAAVALVSAGCGGDDEESSDTTTLADTTTDDTTTDDETTTDETSDDEDLDDLSGVFANEDCLALAAAVSSFAGAFAGQGVSDEATTALEELAEKVPDEIEEDVRVLTDAYAEYADEFAAIGLEEGQTPNAEQLMQLQAASASLGDPEVAAASDRVSAWAEENCTNG